MQARKMALKARSASAFLFVRREAHSPHDHLVDNRPPTSRYRAAATIPSAKRKFPRCLKVSLQTPKKRARCSKFSVKLFDFVATGLGSPVAEPYLKLDFDRIKMYQTDREKADAARPVPRPRVIPGWTNSSAA